MSLSLCPNVKSLLSLLQLSVAALYFCSLDVSGCSPVELVVRRGACRSSLDCRRRLHAGRFNSMELVGVLFSMFWTMARSEAAKTRRPLQDFP